MATWFLMAPRRYQVTARNLSPTQIPRIQGIVMAWCILTGMALRPRRRLTSIPVLMTHPRPTVDAAGMEAQIRHRPKLEAQLTFLPGSLAIPRWTSKLAVAEDE